MKNDNDDEFFILENSTIKYIKLELSKDTSYTF